MNIFACDENSEQAARCLPDKLVVKMPLESAQILCSALWNRRIPAPYLPTHQKHPCVLWAARSAGNWRWLVDHALALCDEYEHRYGREHKSKLVILCVAPLGPHRGRLTSFAMAMPEQYRSEDPVLSYRKYLVAEKSHYATWKDATHRPKWWNQT